jgi:hypothetical protein
LETLSRLATPLEEHKKAPILRLPEQVAPIFPQSIKRDEAKTSDLSSQSFSTSGKDTQQQLVPIPPPAWKSFVAPASEDINKSKPLHEEKGDIMKPTSKSVRFTENQDTTIIQDSEFRFEEPVIIVEDLAEVALHMDVNDSAIKYTRSFKRSQYFMQRFSTIFSFRE